MFNPSERTLLRTGAASAFIAVIVFRRNLSAELFGFNGFGFITIPVTFPESALEWYTLMQRSKLLGLALLDFFDLINYALIGLLFLALFVVLKKQQTGALLVVLALTLIGVAGHFASNQSLAVLSLSSKYAVANGAEQQSQLLAAGEALLAVHYEGAGHILSLLSITTAGLIVSIVMLRNQIFPRVAGYVGIIANGVLLLHFLAMIFMPSLYAIPVVVSAPFRVAWYILIAVRLIKLAN